MKCPTLTFNVSVDFQNDPKFIAAGTDATMLFFRGVAHARKYLTDGFVDAKNLPALLLGLRAPSTLAAKLVEAGLWETCDGGYCIPPDRWGRWQVTTGYVQEKREKWAAKKRVQRSDVPPGHSPRVPRGHEGNVPRGLGGQEEKKKEENEEENEKGEKVPPPQNSLGRDSDRPDRGAAVREAMRAIERWSLRDRNGAGLDAVHREFQVAEDRCTNGWQEDTPILHAGEPVNPLALVPLAVERIMGKPNAPPFKSVQFALGCINNELADMRARGTKPTSSNGVAAPKHDYAKILGGAV
jgi:hypothetical protein